ncbi:hypothetical protein DID88_010224 [Monilinia fructigena]|uniref:proton-translocating NAD(P)(+) transhydrogenase n=1 Tax=Monilinia fructigena TaxID=38457 RepID=A0A395IRA8_9HELO|nr:hypothetical protein DID88_010224 [Monilinia fructigena]
MTWPSTMKPILRLCRANPYPEVKLSPGLTFGGILATYARSLYPTGSAKYNRYISTTATSPPTAQNTVSLSTASYNAVTPDLITTPYSNLTIGIARETYPNEKRVAITPQNAQLLIKKGFSQVLVERGAGAEAQFTDEAYEIAGAKIVTRNNVWSESDILLKVRAPSVEGSNNEVDSLKNDATIISFLYPAVNKDVVEKLAHRGVTAFAMDMIPRISRAQVFDALSPRSFQSFWSLHDWSGYCCWVPPCKVLVIGAGVAGLSAIATARRMGAIVRGFDTRSAAREQVQSLGAEFIEVDVKEDGSGAGGYGKEMSKEFIEAEKKLFMEQCREIDIIICTALIPGRPAPKLIHEDMVAAMKPGSVIVDLAAEAGGNCDVTAAGRLIEHKGVKVIGYTDLPSRLPTQSSTLYSNNITKVSSFYFP